MCGICGKVDLSGISIDEVLLRRMCDSFAHRGPDDEGLFIVPPVALGHRRLSIIDLSPAGHQPMCNEDGSIWLVFNGEIYDYRDLRKDLLSRGHHLKSKTDSEVLIHLYEEEGIECLKHLNGMFAFALWDGTNKRLYLVRDRLGIKPLHFYWDGKSFLFASEIKAILCDPEVPREIDQEALHLYLTLNYIPAPWTIFKNIKKVLPGTYLLLEHDRVVTETYWDIPSPENDRQMGQEHSLSTVEEHKAHLWSLLEDAIQRRLISDVPLGAFLSGGIDSSIIVALTARNSSKPVKTFSIGYKDLPSFDETGYAREVADLNNTDHHEFRLGYKDILETFPKVLENIDEPFADSSAVPTYIVSRETRTHVTVALSGDGGDELFAGYRMYLGEYWARYYSMIPGLIRNKVIEPIIHALPDSRDKPRLEKIRRLKKFLRGMSPSFPERFYGWREVFPFPLQRKLLKLPPSRNAYLDIVHRMVEKESARFGNDTLNLMLYMDLKGLLPNDMLTKVDRMSMANSLEVRVPLLDHTFVEYVFKLKGDLKLKGTQSKFLFIDTFKELLPKSILTRPKWGFEMPVGAWLREELRFLIDEYLSEAMIRRQDIFNFEVIKELISRHMSGRQDTSWHLWNLIVFQHWYRKYMP